MKIIVALLVFEIVFVLGDNNLDQFSESNREFSANIYKELAEENSGNFVGCPMSTEIVLSMVHAGAREKTASQLAHGLSLPNSNTKINSMMKAILPKLESKPQYFTLKSVNKMYVGKDLNILPSFKSTVVDVFKAAVENINFKAKDNAAHEINKWVEEQTENHIKDLISVQDITDETKAVLLNAMYFQATWAKRFYEGSTKKTDFHTGKIGKVLVDMMDKTDSFGYHECSDLKSKYLKMDYLGSDLSMVVVLPDEKDGLPLVESKIHEVLKNQKYDYKKVHVNFPKFKMDATIKFIPILEKLGVIDLFKPHANLHGISSDSQLYITNVIQKNYIEVNEKGTMAASATAAIAGVGASFDPEPPKEFIADHPFLYYINSPAGNTPCNILANFNFEFWELAEENSGNFVGCPMSTETVLSMVHAGAREKTASQLAHGLSLPNSKTQINSMMKAILPKLESRPQLFTLKSVNKMYVGKDLNILPGFKSTVVDVFKAAVENINFKDKDHAVHKMNNWVEEQSENHIKDLISVQDITDETKAVLLNAMYFQATWLKRFYVGSTKKTDFHTGKVGKVLVDMMDNTDSYGYHECSDIKSKYLKMDYLGIGLSMVVVLPDEIDGLPLVESKIHEVLKNQKYDYKKVHVNFPKFKMDATIKFIPILEKLGVIDLFKPHANLHGISSDSQLYITNVIQKNYIEVNEKGTMAASATAAIAGVGASFDPEPPKEFIADHPFLYYIDSPAGILFIGRYSGH
ncbi:hypothetical protein RN001_010726 [Aquatica leii]|uniref:Serpin domain-containing protein n=1 Tax=Aquatica leii TaxID=1421715 RepID=A0AAN7SQG4_9COLE|nr:hypothetical protein RN001_010726 [Aquatica leii]